MVVAGPEDYVNRFYENMSKILSQYNVKVMHFNEIDKRILKKASRALAELINSYKKILFMVFEHKKPAGKPYRGYFLNHVPEKMAEYLKSFDNRNRLLLIDVHDDYRVPGITDSTKLFMDKLIRKTSRHISKDDIGIKIIPNGKVSFEYSSKILSKDGNYMKIRIRCMSQRNSKPINIADMSLGFFKTYRFLVREKIKFRRI